MVAWYWLVIVAVIAAFIAFWLGYFYAALTAAARDRRESVPGKWAYPERRKDEPERR